MKKGLFQLEKTDCGDSLREAIEMLRIYLTEEERNTPGIKAARAMLAGEPVTGQQITDVLTLLTGLALRCKKDPKAISGLYLDTVRVKENLYNAWMNAKEP